MVKKKKKSEPSQIKLKIIREEDIRLDEPKVAKSFGVPKQLQKRFVKEFKKEFEKKETKEQIRKRLQKKELEKFKKEVAKNIQRKLSRKLGKKVISRRVLRPNQQTITIKKQPVQQQIKNQFFKQELIGAQNVLFGN